MLAHKIQLWHVQVVNKMANIVTAFSDKRKPALSQSLLQVALSKLISNSFFFYLFFFLCVANWSFDYKYTLFKCFKYKYQSTSPHVYGIVSN